MTNQYKYRPATLSDYQQLLVLLPQLADFEIPAQRIAKDLWEGDAKLLKAALQEKAAIRFADVAVARVQVQIIKRPRYSEDEFVFVKEEIRGW